MNEFSIPDCRRIELPVIYKLRVCQICSTQTTLICMSHVKPVWITPDIMQCFITFSLNEKYVRNWSDAIMKNVGDSNCTVVKGQLLLFWRHMHQRRNLPQHALSKTFPFTSKIKSVLCLKWSMWRPQISLTQLPSIAQMTHRQTWLVNRALPLLAGWHDCAILRLMKASFKMHWSLHVGLIVCPRLKKPTIDSAQFLPFNIGSELFSMTVERFVAYRVSPSYRHVP